MLLCKIGVFSIGLLSIVLFNDVVLQTIDTFEEQEFVAHWLFVVMSDWSRLLHKLLVNGVYLVAGIAVCFRHVIFQFCFSDLLNVAVHHIFEWVQVDKVLQFLMSSNNIAVVLKRCLVKVLFYTLRLLLTPFDQRHFPAQFWLYFVEEAFHLHFMALGSEVRLV